MQACRDRAWLDRLSLQWLQQKPRSCHEPHRILRAGCTVVNVVNHEVPWDMTACHSQR